MHTYLTLIMIQLVKTAFLREVNLQSWDEAEAKYPKYTTRDKLSVFMSYNYHYGNRPAALVAFARAAAAATSAEDGTSQSQVADAFIGLNGSCRGYILNMDVLKVDDIIIKECTHNFQGFHLAIIDFPEVTHIYVHCPLACFSLKINLVKKMC